VREALGQISLLLSGKWSLASALKATATVLGVPAPTFLWVAAAILPLWAAYELIGLVRITRAKVRLYRRLDAALRPLMATHSAGPQEGLGPAGYDAVARSLAAIEPLRDAWRKFDAQLIRRQRSGEDRYWSAEHAEIAFPEVGRHLPHERTFYGSFPGFLTGIGLLLTFLAILIALLDVRIGDNQQVQGLDTLIHGLSGKFITSIAALMSASVFTVLEKRQFYRLDRSRSAAFRTLDRLVPRLSMTQILAEVGQDAAAQTLAFRNFDADLSTKLREGFGESMGPILERMVNASEELTALIRTAEGHRSDQLASSVESLVRNLEASIVVSLREMTDRFTQAMSGATRNEFDRVAASLAGAATVLDSMSRQFQDIPRTLTELMAFARNSSTEQAAVGREQVNELTGVLRSLMAELHDRATTSIQTMAASFSQTLSDMSSQFHSLQARVTEVVTETTGKAAGATTSVVAAADEWMTRAQGMLSMLLDRHEGLSGELQAARESLAEVVTRFRESLQQYTDVSRNVGVVSDQVAASVGSMKQAGDAMSTAGSAFRDVAGQVSGQVERLARADELRAKLWERMEGDLARYQDVFLRIEETGGRLLEQIARYLRDYSETSQLGLEKVIQMSDGYFKDATMRLSGTVNGLKEHLDALEESLEGFRAALERNRPRS